MALVMLVVMSVKPDEPSGLFKPASLRDVHGKMEIFIQKVVQAERRHSAEEDIGCCHGTDPKKERSVQTDYQRRVPPRESDIFVILS